MVKKQLYQEWFIKDAQDAEDDYDDEHYDEFYNFLLYELLINIKQIPFDHIIQNHLQCNQSVFRTKEANCLCWLYTADRKLINSLTVYSFRFANLCDPELYKIFEIKAHHLFQLVPGPRHKSYGWYKCIGHELLNDIDQYLNIQKVVQNSIPHKTKLYIHQEEERIDIQFNFYSINERIAINFEPGYPAN